ncbi:MAG: hypothetical protein AB7K71_33170 [Polyangiaceae bacterium]
MKRWLLGCSALVASLGVTDHAHAQEVCSGDDKIIRGTVAHNLMYGAINTNSSVFGAAALVEQHLLPELSLKGSSGAAHYTVTYIPAALRVPTCDLRMQKIDLSGGAFGAGANFGALKLYFAGSTTTHQFASDKANERVASPFYGAGFILGSPIGFFKRRFERDDLSLTFDAMLGAQLDSPEVGSISAAYIASKGLYTNLSEHHLKTFLGLIYQEAADTVQQGLEDQKDSFLDRFPYLKAGLSDLDWLVGDAAETVGSTRMFARRLKYQGVAPSNVPRDQVDEVKSQSLDFATAHFEQYKILKFLDVSVAGAWEPEPFLHELTIAASAGQSLPEDMVLGRMQRAGIDHGEDGYFFGLRGAVGMVRMPKLWYYGVEGGPLFRFSVDIMMGGQDPENDSYNMFFLTFGMNTPETLALFPFAQNSGFMKMSGSFVF